MLQWSLRVNVCFTLPISSWIAHHFLWEFFHTFLLPLNLVGLRHAKKHLGDDLMTSWSKNVLGTLLLKVRTFNTCLALLCPCSTELLAHPSLVGSKVYFFSSPTEDYCVTVWWIWFVFVDYQVSVWCVGRDLMRRKCPDDGTKCRSDTDLIVDKHKSDSSDCDTIVFRRWKEEINLASDEWRMSQKLCGTGVLVWPCASVKELGGSRRNCWYVEEHFSAIASCMDAGKWIRCMEWKLSWYWFDYCHQAIKFCIENAPWSNYHIAFFFSWVRQNYNMT